MGHCVTTARQIHHVTVGTGPLRRLPGNGKHNSICHLLTTYTFWLFLRAVAP